MKRLFILSGILAVIGFSFIAKAQVGQIPDWPPAKYVSSGGTYTGPGDLSGVTTPISWYGLRAYSASYATLGGASFDWACTNGSSFTGTVHVAASGGLSSSDMATISSDCGAQTVTVTKLYDQTGNHYDVSQATTANQPTLTVNCISSLPCLVFNGTSQYFAGIDTPTFTGNTTLTSVAMRTGNTTAFNAIVALRGTGGGGNEIFFGSSASTAGVFGGSVLSASATDSAWHSITGVVNTGTGYVIIDGTQTAGTAGTNAPDLPIYIGAYKESGTVQQYLAGDFVEGGSWNVDLGATVVNTVCHNEKTYWGVTATC